jgi:hypothetical protein
MPTKLSACARPPTLSGHPCLLGGVCVCVWVGGWVWGCMCHRHSLDLLHHEAHLRRTHTHTHSCSLLTRTHVTVMASTASSHVADVPCRGCTHARAQDPNARAHTSLFINAHTSRRVQTIDLVSLRSASSCGHCVPAYPRCVPPRALTCLYSHALCDIVAIGFL